MKVGEGCCKGGGGERRGERVSNRDRETQQREKKTERGLTREKNPSSRPSQCLRASASRPGCWFHQGQRGHHRQWGGPSLWVHSLRTRARNEQGEGSGVC